MRIIMIVHNINRTSTVLMDVMAAEDALDGGAACQKRH